MTREAVVDWIDHFQLYWEGNISQAKKWLIARPEDMRILGHTLDAAFHSFIYMPPPAIVGEKDLGLTATTTEASAATNATCILAFGGIYPQAFHSLRQILEMSILCSYFTLYEKGSGRIKTWREGRYPSPRFSECLKKIAVSLRQAVQFGAFEPDEYRILYSHLSSWTHLHRAGHEYFFVPDDAHHYFNEDAFTDWTQSCLKTLRLSVIILLATFPSYTLKLPEDQVPDSWVGPWNWTFPKPAHTTLVAEVVGEPQWSALKQLTVNDTISRTLLTK